MPNDARGKSIDDTLMTILHILEQNAWGEKCLQTWITNCECHWYIHSAVPVPYRATRLARGYGHERAEETLPPNNRIFGRKSNCRLDQKHNVQVTEESRSFSLTANQSQTTHQLRQEVIPEMLRQYSFLPNSNLYS